VVGTLQNNSGLYTANQQWLVHCKTTVVGTLQNNSGWYTANNSGWYTAKQQWLVHCKTTVVGTLQKAQKIKEYLFYIPTGRVFT
jgi:hypothetical protein